MRVSIWPIKNAKSWGYLTGSCRDAIPSVNVILINIIENETETFKWRLFIGYDINR